MQAPALLRTDPAHRDAAAGAGNDAQVLYRSVAQSSVDGNTVDIDGERSRFMENAVHYEANLVFLSGQMKMLMTAIQGQ
jgi:flagellar basal-body rod protein FlgB